jgi:diamine N-acetyltransferase
MLHLEPITYKNVWDVVDLKVARSQRSFVADNVCSIVTAYAVQNSGARAFPFGIYNGKKPVGFVMIGFNDGTLYDVEDIEPAKVSFNNYSIWRLMIDKRYQGRGYGREAIGLALDFVRTFPCGRAEYCFISWEPENEVAAKLYHSCGFVENGEMDGDEIIAVLKL